MKRTLALLCFLVIPFHVLAAETPISRRDGFLLIWQSLGRPAQQTNKASFEDVNEGDAGFTELLYAKSRKILDDEDRFFPDEPLRLGETLTWLLRSRNIDDPENISVETLSGYLMQYPIAALPTEEQASAPITQETLLYLAQSLDDHLKNEVHEASLYAEKWHGKGTAFGEKFDMHMMTAAHRTFPHNTLVRVTNIANGKSVVVRINDRGPFVKGRDMDLSLAAFTTIEERSRGILRATFQRLGDVSVVYGCDSSMRRYQTRLSRNQRLLPGIPWTLPLGEPLAVRSNAGFALRSVRYPDGTVTAMQDWITKEEVFTFKPSVTGLYEFTLSALNGVKKTFSMQVTECAQ